MKFTLEETHILKNEINKIKRYRELLGATASLTQIEIILELAIRSEEGPEKRTQGSLAEDLGYPAPTIARALKALKEPQKSTRAKDLQIIEEDKVPDYYRIRPQHLNKKGINVVKDLFR